MKKSILFLTILALLVFSNTVFSQKINFGIISSFTAYTGAGAVSNGPGANFTGDVGTNVGAISGFGSPPSFTGNMYNANASTDQAKKDLFRIYIHLNDLFVDYPATHTAAFGGGETISPGVYSIPGAGSLGGAITLDGGGNPDAFFVIKFYGAFTAGTDAVVNLTGGTKSCNVFWIAEGAITVAANANIKGTLFAKVGAVSVGTNAVLEGRMLSLTGAITIESGATVSPPPCTSTIPIFCESDCSPAPAVDVLGVLSNFALFTSDGAAANTSISGIDGNIGTNNGSISGYGSSVVVGSLHNSDALTAQAKIDVNKAYNALMALPNTVLSHTPAFGSGETINAGVYYIGGAGSLAGTITLDGQNNPNAIFVFKFAGAFSVGAQSKIILANGARRCNVFWIGGAGISSGAVSIGAGSVLKGTFLSHGGACSSGADVFLAGRLLSTGGAVNTYSGIIYNNPVCVTSPPLGCVIDAPTSGGNLTVCYDGSITQTLTATATATAGTILWYDSATAGNLVLSPTLIGIGTKTYYAQASNGTCVSLTRTSVTLTITRTLDQPTLSGVNQPSCTKATGSFTITNYNASYTYTAFPSTGVTISGNLINAPAGTYTVKASLGACNSIPSANITVNAQPIVPNAPISGGNQTVCSDGSTTQTLTATATGGSISWYDSATAGNIVTSPTLIGIGTKTYYAEASNGTCSSLTRIAVTLTITSALAQPTLSGVTQPSCTKATGSFTITNYNEAYTYMISPSTGVIISGNLINAPAGTYTVKASLGACNSIPSDNITVNPQSSAPAQPILKLVSQTSCTFTKGSFMVTNYNSSYTYTASPSTGVTISGDLITAPTGTYTITATLGTCSSIASSNLTINTQPELPSAPTSGGNQTVCSNGSTTQTLTATATGGSISWYDSATAGNIVTSPTLIGIGTKTYYAEASNGNCVSLTRTAVTLTITTTLTQPTLSGVTQPACTTVSGSFTITNYNEAYTYMVSPSTGVIISGNLINAPAGTYTVKVSLGACNSIPSANITVNPQSSAPAQPILKLVSQTSCTFTKGSFMVTNYNSSYTYTASPSTGVTISGDLITAPTGTYTITATLGTCSSIASSNLTINTQPGLPSAPTSGGNQTVCSNGSTTQTLTATATGGSISWYDSATAGNIVTSPTLIGVGTKTYYAEANNGTCASLTRTAVTLTITPALTQPTLGAVLQPTDSFSTGSFIITNYNSAYTYLVSPSIGVSISGSKITAPTGNYTVRASIGACTSIASATIILNPQLPKPPCSLEGMSISKILTPNNDGYNDDFKITGLEGCNLTLGVKIFNRWGKMVYQSDNYQNNWNGKYEESGKQIGSNSDLPTGTYFYIVTVSGGSGFKPVTGYIYLGTQ